MYCGGVLPAPAEVSVARTTVLSTTILTVSLLLGGCIQGGVTQVAGTGAVYTTKCSAEMKVKGDEYFARCTPAPCSTNYIDGPISHVVVSMDPGNKLVGYAERTCIQDLSQASGLFNPAPPPEEAQADEATE